jgi:transposase
MRMILKEVFGVDVANNELVISFGCLNSDLSIDILAHKVVKNTQNGFCTFLLWANEQHSLTVPFRVVMEATGNYHQKFAYYLSEKGYEVSIVLPNKISNYQRTLKVKTITDKSMSECICRFGLERKLELWQIPQAIYRSLQQLTRERNQIVDERSAIKNQQHAEELEAYPNPKTIQRLKSRIAFLNEQEHEIKQELDILIDSDEQLKASVKSICTIPGIGRLTVATILGETNGFELIRNKRQLVSYCGYDVVEKTSGTSVRSKTKMSKKGNVHIRKAMHLPALSAIRHDENFKGFYIRLIEKSGIKMKGVVAVSRKLLELIFVLFTKNENYDLLYEKNKAEAQLASALQKLT